MTDQSPPGPLASAAARTTDLTLSLKDLHQLNSGFYKAKSSSKMVLQIPDIWGKETLINYPKECFRCGYSHRSKLTR